MDRDLDAAAQARVRPASKAAFLLHKEGCTIEDYRLVVRIGEGSFGEVWKADRCGSLVALKILKTSLTSEETQRELKSLEVLRALRNPYLLHAENFWSDGDRLYIEMELADGGTLKDRLRAYQATGQRALPETELLKFFSEAAQGLDYLHGQRPLFLHRDIKPANILLVKGCAKLGDFGLLRQVAGDHSQTKTQGGTFPYMAPESIASDVFSPGTDLFSFAVSYVELRQGELPFPGKNQYQICERILREPPELADLFHPDERQVLLKALAKDPPARFRSCGEFIFELNRVVPWTAAATIAEMAPVRQAEPSARQLGTFSSKTGSDDPGTSRKRPSVTMPEVDLPPVEDTGDKDITATPIRAARDDSTSKPARVAAAAPVAVAATAAAPAPTTVAQVARATMPPRARSRLPAVLGAAAVLLVAIAGIWFVMSHNVTRGVQASIDGKKYVEALAAIEASNPLLLTNAAQWRSEVEVAWFAQLHEPGSADTADTLKKSLRELDQFDAAFPNHNAARARRGAIQERLQGIVKSEVDDCLAARDFSAGRAVVSGYASVLPDGGAALRARIKEKEDALKHQAVAPKVDAQAADAALAAAWKALAADPVALEAARQGLKQARIQFGKSPPSSRQDLHARAIDMLLRAHEAPREGGRSIVMEIIARLREGDAALGEQVWPALARLDRSKALLDFDDLDTLPVPPAAAQHAGAQLFTQVLERRVRRDDYAWLPTKSETDKIVTWCEQRIGKSSGVVNALRAECLLAAGAALPQVNELTLPDDGGWYPTYVRALVKERNGQVAQAADLLADLVKTSAKAIRPAARAKNAVAVLHRAALGLPRRDGAGRPFDSAADAGKAARWLRSVLDLDAKAANADAASLAVAVAQLDDATTTATLDRLEKLVLAQADPGQGLAGLGDAYRLLVHQDHGKGERARQFALRWRRQDLEKAAGLFAEAVRLEAQAAFAAAKPPAREQAKLDAFDRALVKTDDAVYVPAIIAKVALAWSDDFPAEARAKTVAQGDEAWRLAAAAEKTRSTQRAWWQEQHCTGLVRLADARIKWIFQRLTGGEKFTEPQLRAQYTPIRALYEDARGMKRYTERWHGELAFKIGFMHVKLGDKEQAAIEFMESLRRIQTTTEPYRDEVIRAEVQQFRQFMEKTLPTLKQQ